MKQKNQNLIQQLINGALILAVIGLLGFLSVRYQVQQDWTFGKRNTLTEGSRQQLAAMDGPVQFVAFSYPGGEDRAAIEYYVEQYRRFKPDVTLEFIDPTSQPQKVKDYNVSFAGEVVVEYQGRRESLRQFSEQSITGALQRLAYSGDTFVVFVSGHGERSLEGGQSQAAFAKFAQALQDKGLKAQTVNLIENPSIPDNTAVLVLASPASALLEGEIRLIDEYVKSGGNLLWLADPDNPPGLAAVAATLGIEWQNGYAVFPEYELLGLDHPGIYVALGYPPGPVTQGLEQVTMFPLVRSVSASEDSGWIAQPMLSTSPEAWLETSALDGGSVSLDVAAGDIAGPLDIGLTLTRQQPLPDAPIPEAREGEPPPAAPTRQQRVALIGDADFLSDAYLAQLGNQSLGLNLVQWLAARDNQLNIDIPKAPDANLFLAPWAQVLLGVGFVLLLPLALLGFGIGRWYVRRRR